MLDKWYTYTICAKEMPPGDAEEHVAMTVDEVLPRVIELLERQGWTSFRTLRRRFHLDDSTLSALLEELATVPHIVIETAAGRLLWQGASRPLPTSAWESTRDPQHAHDAALPGSGVSEVDTTSAASRHTDQRTLSTFVIGREAEFSLVQQGWERSQTGQGQVVLITGEAGVGKSHLVRLLKTALTTTPHLRWECRCDLYYQHSAFYPLVNFLERACHYTADDTATTRLRKMEATLAPYQVPLAEMVPIFATLLDIPLDDRYLPYTLPAAQRKQQVMDAMVALLRLLASQHPVLLILEDVHWADPSTLEMLQRLASDGATMRLYLLLTSRPEFRPPWPHQGHHTQVTVNRLLPAQAQRLAQQIAGADTLPAALLEHLVAKAEGVPLYVEELTRMALDAGTLPTPSRRSTAAGVVPEPTLPATLHDSLLARLDALGAAKDVAQIAAAWGRAVTEAQLQALTVFERRQLGRALERLVRADILKEVNLPPRVTYVFRHALLQAAAYDSMPLARRQQVHACIAQALVDNFSDTVATQPELLAQHYTAAALIEPAVSAWQRAGQRAIEHSAHAEAVTHLQHGIALLQSLPDTPARARQELALQTSLGVALKITRGYAAHEVEQVYVRARDLCQQVADHDELYRVLHGLWSGYAVRGELATAQQVGEDLLALVQSRATPGPRVVAHYSLGMTLFWRGALQPARTQLEHAIAIHMAQSPRTHTTLNAAHPLVVCLCYLCLVLWLLGYPEQALARVQEAYTLAQNLAHPYSLAWACFFTAQLYQYRQNPTAVLTWIETTVQLCTQHGYAQWLAQGTVLRGWALTMQGHTADGLAQMQQGLSAYRATGARIGRAAFLALLARGYQAARQATAGLDIIAEALETLNDVGDRWWEAELHRLQGECLLMQPAGAQPQTAVDCFQRALAVARSQQARSLELRAASSLSHLWLAQGQGAEARQLLTSSIAWFTEGFDTVDIQQAQALLSRLTDASYRTPNHCGANLDLSQEFPYDIPFI